MDAQVLKNEFAQAKDSSLVCCKSMMDNMDRINESKEKYKLNMDKIVLKIQADKEKFQKELESVNQKGLVNLSQMLQQNIDSLNSQINSLSNN